MLIYRVCNRSGDGPYREWSYDSPLCQHRTKNLRCLPEHDGMLLTDDNSRFGFVSIDSLYTWFEKESRDWLKDRGYKISVYKANPTEVGITGQCKFVLKKATLLHILPLETSSRTKKRLLTVTKRMVQSFC